MASLTRLLERNLRNSSAVSATGHRMRVMCTQPEQPTTRAENDLEEEEFRVLNLRAGHQNVRKTRVFTKMYVPPPRELKMPTDQDWTAVWPGPRSFHPASVPLPLRQGYTEKAAPAPAKYANAELMKIPNFLHLTPPAIKQQCEALKKFCTPWPKGLEKKEKWRRHFPLHIVSTDYCHGLPTIRHPEARRVTLRLKLSLLKFDAHAKDKFLRLVGDRYDLKTDLLTIVADRCPLRKQNYDYALYLLTACYHESFITEPWEASKSEADMEYFYFKRNKSKESAEAILNWGSEEKVERKQAAASFAESVEQLINEGENEQNLSRYKQEVKQLLGIASN